MRAKQLQKNSVKNTMPVFYYGTHVSEAKAASLTLNYPEDHLRSWKCTTGGRQTMILAKKAWRLLLFMLDIYDLPEVDLHV